MSPCFLTARPSRTIFSIVLVSWHDISPYLWLIERSNRLSYFDAKSFSRESFIVLSGQYFCSPPFQVCRNAASGILLLSAWFHYHHGTSRDYHDVDRYEAARLAATSAPYGHIAHFYHLSPFEPLLVLSWAFSEIWLIRQRFHRFKYIYGALIASLSDHFYCSGSLAFVISMCSFHHFIAIAYK